MIWPDFVIRRGMLAASLSLAPGLMATAGQGPLPIATGTYVQEGVACADPPFAAEFQYDGRSLTDPHSTACHDTVLSRHGSLYGLQETCGAEGDGTAIAPFTERNTYDVLSPERIVRTRVTAGRRSAVTFRLCSGPKPDPASPR